jgi:type I restriction enzyme, R subunit
MAVTDTSEKGLESLIVESLVRDAAYVQGRPEDYDRAYAVDISKLLAFLEATQPEAFQQLGLGTEGIKRTQFLSRLQGEIAKRGIIEVLRRGVSHGPASLELFYGTPSPGNAQAAARFTVNTFSVTRQLRYSGDETKLALDLCIFINGLPVATFELKNRLTKQTVEDAVQQYKNDREPRELLFQFGRCLVHLAVDDQEVRFCTHLQGKSSWFLPFNKGYNDGAGNPPNPNGLKTDYLWKEVLSKQGLTDVIENYAQIIEEKNEKTSRKSKKQIFPRYHQLDVVRKLIADARGSGPGICYLIQHSAGSGKSGIVKLLTIHSAP